MSLYQPHTATFNGRHNRSKSMVLIYLEYRHHRNLQPVSAAEIHRATGVSLYYLRNRLTYWAKPTWAYIKRRVRVDASGGPKFVYEIAKRGIQFVYWRIPDDKRNQYISEINNWQKGMSN